MRRFEKAQSGDDVYSMIHGDCFVIGKGLDLIYIKSKEKEFSDMSYSLTGSYFFDIGEPILFYRKGSEKYLTERPVPEVDWNKVSRGTKVVVSNILPLTGDEPTCSFLGYFPELEYPYWIFHAQTGMGFKYCKLAELCKPEWKK